MPDDDAIDPVEPDDEDLLAKPPGAITPDDEEVEVDEDEELDDFDDIDE
jgi:hypothetical protein